MSIARASLVALSLALGAVGCSSHYPASPVPAPLSDLEAARLGGTFLNDHSDRHAMLHSALRQQDGYLLAYTTVLDPTGAPPKQSHLVIIRNDGTIREVQLKEGH